MTTAAEGTSNFQTTTTRPRETTMGQQIVKVLTTTDHKIFRSIPVF